ncbi:hypothetical protein SK128_027662, partial [Halocaridina rubra]
LSILEYRKRKSVNSDSDGRGGTLLQTQNVCATDRDVGTGPSGSSVEVSGSPASSTSKDHSDAESPSSPGSPPDLPLSPIQPLSLMLIPDVLDKSVAKDDIKKEDGTNKLEEDAGIASASASSFGSIRNGNISSAGSKGNNDMSKITSILTDRTTVSKQPLICDSLLKNSCISRLNNMIPNNIKAIGKVPIKVPNVPLKNSKNGSSEIVGAPIQDVKWNAAPTLLERQRENLTERLRREFGLCVSDDDEEKLDDDREKLHRRAKEKNLPPPPPPPTAPPKNSIFHGREVTVQKVPCSTKLVTVPSVSQGSGTSSAIHNSQANNSNRLPVALPQSSSHSAAHNIPTIMSYSSAVVPPHLPVPPPPTVGSLNPNGSSSGLPLTSVPPPRPLHPPPSLLPTTSSDLPSGPASIPLPCAATSSRAVSSVSRVVVQRHTLGTGTQAMGETAARSRLPLIPSSGQISQHLPTTAPPPSAYPVGSYPRSIYPTPSGTLPQSLSVYSPARVPPPPPPCSDVGVPPRPVVGSASVRQPPPPPPLVPPGGVAPSLVYNSNGYPGIDCSASGSRGS